MLVPDFNPDSPTFLHAAELFVHIAAGSVSILAGFAALIFRKGDRAHRTAGAVFVAAMLTMTAFAALIALQKGQPGNLVGSAMTAYLVLTAWLTVRRRELSVGGVERLGMLAAAAIGLSSIGMGLSGVSPSGASGPPGDSQFAVIFYVFGGISLLAAALDLWTLNRGGLAGADRISRHLWRMCLATFVATGSFFLGQQDEFPAALRGAYLFIPAFAPLVALLFWLIRVRIGKRFRPVAAAA